MTRDVPERGERRDAAIGIAVGGTKIAAGIVTLPDGAVLQERATPTDAGRGSATVLCDLKVLCASLFDQAASLGTVIRGIGIGIPETVALDGHVTSAETVAWRGTVVADAFADLARVRVESDVRAAAVAEARFGAGRPHPRLLYVNIGTGISSTLVENGIAKTGARGNTLVLASGTIRVPCERCGEPTAFVVERYATGPAMVARYNALEPVATIDTGERLFALATTGDTRALEVLRTAAGALGNTIAAALNLLDPDALVIGGGIGLAGGVFWDTLVPAIRRDTWAPATRGLPILPAALGHHAGIVGAALLSIEPATAGPGHSRTAR